MDMTPEYNFRLTALEPSISVWHITVVTDGDFKECHVDLFWQDASVANVYPELSKFLRLQL